MARGWAWAVDATVAVVVGIVGIYVFHHTRDSFFLVDDWGLLNQADSRRGLVEPYNDHLTVTVLVTYRAMIEVFGFSFTSFRVFGLVCLLGVPLSHYATTRRHLGPALAAVAALSLVVVNLVAFPSAGALYLSLIGAILCAAALNRGPQADWVLAAALVLAMASSSAGVAVAAACLVHNVAARPPRRRWLVVLGPILLWGCWWLVARGHGSRFDAAEAPTWSQALSYFRHVLQTPFEIGPSLVTVLLASAFLAHGVWRLRQGLGTAANLLAWTTALLVWAAGLAYSRGWSGIDQSRYELLSLGFVLLALVPRDPIDWSARSSRWPAAFAVAILAVGLVRGAAVRDEIDHRTPWLAGYGHIVKCQIRYLDELPDDRPMGAFFFNLSAEEVRVLVDRYGNPSPRPEDCRGVPRP